MKRVAIWLIKAYQLTISPFLGNCCRFLPTCSEYAVEAIQKHGLRKGSFLALKRVGKCHPWSRKNPGGIDPVP